MAGDQSSMVLKEERWSMDGGQGYACMVPAGLWKLACKVRGENVIKQERSLSHYISSMQHTQQKQFSI